MQKLIKISEEQIIRIQVVKSIFNVSVSNEGVNTEFNITGISVLPQFIEVKPNNIRGSILDKSQTEGGAGYIDSFTQKGIYFVNIRDYAKDEILHLSEHISKKWLDEIWSLLTTKESKPYSVTLKDKKVKEIILEENRNLFKKESDFDNFCLKYRLSIKSFIEAGKFSELDVKLKEIEARFDLEQFYARLYLFCSSLISQLNKRILEYTSNGNQLETEKLNLLNLWIKQMQRKLDIIRNFNDYYKLYDMPKSDNKIEINDSNNVIIGNDLSNSKLTQKNNDSSESKFSKRIKVMSLIIITLGLIVTIIINWDKIF
jgi:hypothetical protein